MDDSKRKKNQSMALVGLYYLIAICAGIITFLSLEWENALYKMFVADIVATLVIWGFGIYKKNASVYDPFWSFIPPFLVAGWIFILQPAIQLTHLLFAFAVTLWAVRLTLNWASGWTDFSDQDWRYTMIQKAHPKVWFLSNLVGINLMPTIVVFIQFIGIQEFLQKNIAWNLWFLLGLIICLGAVYLEFTADRQMAIFKNRNCGQKKCIQEGLWKYSRHPNYFGEVSMWWGVWLMYFSGNQKIDFLILPPVLMTALFLFISIPMMEKKMVSSRPEYRRIQKQVSMLIPFFPRSEQNDEESAKTGE